MNFSKLRAIAVSGCILSSSVSAELNRAEPDWMAPTIGPLTPSVHFNGAIGSSSADHAQYLAVGHHDPTREDGSVQGLELGASLRLGQLEGFATYVFVYGDEEDWEEEWEEAFLKLRDLPGGFEVRGGRMLGRFGPLNATHLHAWNFVDMPLALGRFLGEHGLWYEGGDITWIKQGLANTYGLTVGYGDAVLAHHEGEDEHEVEDGHAAMEDHAGEEEHHHEHGMAFGDSVTSARFFAQLRNDDFLMLEPGLSLAVGDAEDGRQMVVFGLDFTYTWRENGLEPGGRSLIWKTELLYRDIDDAEAQHEEEEEHDHAEVLHDDEMMPGGGEFGFYSDLIYTLNERFDAGVRFSYVEGNEDLETEERYRISPAITAYLDPYRRATLRVQYNYDDLGYAEDEHAIWAQLGLHWGGGEVR
ncbi:MAG: hypothetical protein ACO3ZG_01950 [Kiritimatiellia bacterium]